LGEIAQQIRIGNKVEAIRIYKEAFNVSLAEAKDAVDALAAGRPVLMPGSQMVGAPVVSVASNPPVTTTFTPQTVASSSRGTTYTITGSTSNTSFIVHWIRLSMIAGPVAFVLAMLALVFPNTSRLAAPVLCPAHYVDAYGTVTSEYDSEGTSYNVEMSCVDAEGQVSHPNGLFMGAILFGLYFGAGVLLAFGLAAVLRFKLAGCVPLLAVLVIVPVACFAYVSLVPAQSGNSLLALFGLDSGDKLSLPDLVPQIEGTFAPILDSSPTPSFAVQLWVVGSGAGTDLGQFNDTRAVAVDGSGNVYTADYSGGRIQVFDSAGTPLSQWRIAGDNIYISDLAADSAGTLYVVYGGNVNRYDGLTGEFLDKYPYDGSYLDQVAVSPNGDVLVASRAELVRFDANGARTLQLTDWGATLSGTFPVSAENIALDAKSNLYIVDMANNAVYYISADGQTVTQLKLGAEIQSPRAIVIDSRGRLYVHDFSGIQVFSDDGALLGSLEVEGIGFNMAMSAQDELLFMDRNANKMVKYKVP
jgi:hypothetical protein